MRQFVFWTGMSSAVAGLGFQFAPFVAILTPTERPGPMTHLFGLVAVFLGVMLAFCSRDLKRRGTLVVWEGVLRLSGFAIMGGFGLFGGGGRLIAIGGLFDLLIGVSYLITVPQRLQVSLADLLLDR